MDELIADSWWTQEFTVPKGVHRADYVSRDGKTLVELKREPTGVRSLHTGIMQLALYLADRPETERACLVLLGSRVSRDRLHQEWRAATGVFAPEIAHRLSIVAIDREGTWVQPEDSYLRRIAETIEPLVPGRSCGESTEAAVTPAAGQKRFELVKVLLCRWLRREGAIPIGRLAEQAGCTYPTASRTLRQLERARSIVRHSNRSVELSRFPQQIWYELVALSGSIRRSLRYVDVSGERPDPQGLLKRLNRLQPPRVALSGVQAARFWHSDFDLHGTPRLDLVCHAPQGRMDLMFMRQLDPALKRTENDSQAAVIAIHPLLRPASLFQSENGNSLPQADPVETALDLYELGLTTQAGQLLTHLRPETRLS